MLGTLIDFKWAIIGGLLLTLASGAAWFVDDYFHKAHLLQQAKTVIEVERRTGATQLEELTKLREAERKREEIVRDAITEIAKIKATCADSAAGRAALDRLRELFGRKTPADNQ